VCDVNEIKDSLIGMHATSILDGCDLPHPCRLSFHLFLVHLISEEMATIVMGDVFSLNPSGVPEDAWDTIFDRALDICLDHTSGVFVPHGPRDSHHKSIYVSVMAVVRLSIDMYHADAARRVPRARAALRRAVLPPPAAAAAYTEHGATDHADVDALRTDCARLQGEVAA